MSSYIIAGSADSIDTAYCEEVARRIKAKYKNIDFRVVIKHPTEWEQYLQQICRIYGFLKKSNPIIYTFDGKIIGNRQAFLNSTIKYFGMDEESLIVQDLTSRINMKIAEQELNRKKIVKNNIKTLEEKICYNYDNLLKKKIMRHQLKQKDYYLVNGIQYIHTEVKNMYETIKFTKFQQIPILNVEVIPQDINLSALVQQDQIKLEQGGQIKEAFVTANQKQKHPSSEQDRMSEASKTNKTNKMHQSIVSADKDSKGFKDSNQAKLKIDEEVDDVPDYIDEPLKDQIICQLGDDFWVAFEKQSHIKGEMIFYHNENSNGNCLRVHNDGRPIKGHRVIIKEVHFQNPNLIEGNVEKKQNDQSGQIDEEPQKYQQPQQVQKEQKKEQNKKDQVKQGKQQNKQQEKKEQKQGTQQQIRSSHHQKIEIQKSKTEPNIPAQSEAKIIEDDAFSEHFIEDLNLISHLNHHTLFIQSPLSKMQLKNVIHFIKETDTIGCLQFLPQNPNPSMKLFYRKFLLCTEKINFCLPVEKFIDKQDEENQITCVTVPSEKDINFCQDDQTFKLSTVNDLGFEHYIYMFESKNNEQQISKVIKATVDHILAIEEQVKRDIGYNLIITKKFLMIVPLVNPYQIYNGNKIYLDGLAFLGFVHTAKLQKSYQIETPIAEPINKGAELRCLLAKSTGSSLEI